MRLRFVLLAALFAAPHAQATPELARQFARQADLDVTSDGLVMLVLPPEVAAATRADLADLRITDRSGREVPFFVEASRPRTDLRSPLRALVRDVERSLETPDGEQPRVRERYVLAPIETLVGDDTGPPAPGERWALRLDTPVASFVRSARIEARGADGLLTELIADAPLFRVDGAERTRIVLPPLTGELVVTLTGREREYVGGAVFRFVPLGVAQPESTAVVSLLTLSEQSGAGKTTLTLARPLGLVPDALRVSTPERAFSRRVRVLDPQPTGPPSVLGEGAIASLADAPGAQALEIALQAAARSDRILFEIDDRDSPPLRNLRVSALVAQPALVFTLADYGDSQPDGTLHFGGGQALRPIYDLASLAELFPNPAQLERALASIDPGALTLGPLRNNPSFAPTPALAFAMQPGAQLDLRGFARRRALVVPPSANGLSRYRFAPEDVAAARPDLADVRVVAAGNAQWPFLLAPDGAREWREIAVLGAKSEARSSRYALELPASGIRAVALELETDAPYFDRVYRLVTRDADGAERALAGGRLLRAPERPLPVRIALPGSALASAELVIENGDDAPLAFTRASLQIVLPELFVTAPPGSYRLLLGDPEATAPAYELERVRDSVLAVPSAAVAPGALEANPEFSAARGFASGVRGRTLLVWVVLGAAVAVLAALTLRAARSEGPDPKPPPA